MTEQVEVPPGMVVVSSDEFYAWLKRDPRDIMPSVMNPDYTSWEYQRTRDVVGRSLPGWKRAGDPNVPKVYMMLRTLWNNTASSSAAASSSSSTTTR